MYNTEIQGSLCTTSCYSSSLTLAINRKILYYIIKRQRMLYTVMPGYEVNSSETGKVAISLLSR